MMIQVGDDEKGSKQQLHFDNASQHFRHKKIITVEQQQRYSLYVQQTIIIYEQKE